MPIPTAAVGGSRARRPPRMRAEREPFPLPPHEGAVAVAPSSASTISPPTRTGVAIGCLYLSPQNVQGHFPRVPHTLLLRVARDGLIFPGWKGSALSSSPAAHPPPFPHQTASLRTTSKQSLSHCSCSQRAQMHVFLPDSLLLP